MRSILVIGGTGKVGSRLTRILRNNGEKVIVGSRNHGDVMFDWRDSETYGPALEGANGVFLVGPGSATDWTGLIRLFLAQAESAGVIQVVLLSARGVEFLPDGVVARAEHAVKQGPIPWTILRPSHFDQNFTEAMFVPVNDVVIAPVAKGAEPFIDVEDLAEVAASILSERSHAGETIELSGPAAITFDSALEILSEYAGRPLRFVDEDPSAHVDRLRAGGTPEGYITWRMAMLDGIRSHADAYISDGVPRVLGRPATSFAAWAQREADSLRDANVS
jgi:uncharacterized protein YbjT (DUF2867 family)